LASWPLPSRCRQQRLKSMTSGLSKPSTLSTRQPLKGATQVQWRKSSRTTSCSLRALGRRTQSPSCLLQREMVSPSTNTKWRVRGPFASGVTQRLSSRFSGSRAAAPASRLTIVFGIATPTFALRQAGATFSVKPLCLFRAARCSPSDAKALASNLGQHMTTPSRGWIFLAMLIASAGSAIHVAAILGGPSWYAFFDAPPFVVASAQAGTWLAPVSAAVIAGLMSLCAVYAASALGLIRQLPLLRLGLAGIAASTGAVVEPLRIAGLPAAGP